MCLLAQHPLVLEEFSRLLSASRFDVRTRTIEPSPGAGQKAPKASVYVVDALAQRAANESVVATLLQGSPQARLVMVAEKFNEASAFPLLRLGVKALVTYQQARERLRDAVEAVARGGFWVPRTVLAGFVEALLGGTRGGSGARAASRLSRREQQVMDALLENLANKEIASRLNISERTAKFHVSNLLAKFGVRRRADLILLHYHDTGA